MEYGISNYLSDTSSVPFCLFLRLIRTDLLLPAIARVFAYFQAPFPRMEVHRSSRPSRPVPVHPQHPRTRLCLQAVALAGTVRNTRREAYTTSKTASSSRTASSARRHWNQQTRTTPRYLASRMAVTASNCTFSRLLSGYRTVFSRICHPISAPRGPTWSPAAPPMALQCDTPSHALYIYHRHAVQIIALYRAVRFL